MRSLGGEARILNTHSGPAESRFIPVSDRSSSRWTARFKPFVISLASTALIIMAYPNPAAASGSEYGWIASVMTETDKVLPKGVLEKSKKIQAQTITVQNSKDRLDQEQYGWSDLPEWKGLPNGSFTIIDSGGHSSETANQVARALYDKAYTKFLVGDLDTAEQEFQRIVHHYAHSPIAHKAQVAIGKVKERRQVMFRLPSSSVEQWSSNSRFEEFPLVGHERQSEDNAVSLSTAALSKGTMGDFINNVGDRVFFNDRSATLTPEAKFLLRAQAEWLKANKSFHLVIEGHSDEEGSKDYNMTLSANRAASVERFFVQSEINPSRIKTRHYGRQKKIAICQKEACSMQNRRVVTRLIPLNEKK